MSSIVILQRDKFLDKGFNLTESTYSHPLWLPEKQSSIKKAFQPNNIKHLIL
jgi:hypothetical protein